MKGAIIVSSVFTVLIVGLFSLFLWAVSKNSESRKFCLSHGYPEAVTYSDGSGYCLKRTGQTDVVIPFESLRK